MSKEFQTEQEEFWRGNFGEEYLKRNRGDKILSSKMAAFSKMLSKANPIKSSLEFGSNIGLNEIVLGLLFPGIMMETVEINKTAADECSNIKNVTVHNESIFTFTTTKTFDLTFTCGVLIHINPDKLDVVYDKLYNCSNRYVLICEYYNPTPVEVTYRGETGKLFKRDFAGEMMDKYEDLKLVDYGFVYHRDPVFPVDDNTWFLLEKR